jgi:hypothetical protein
MISAFAVAPFIIDGLGALQFCHQRDVPTNRAFQSIIHAQPGP